MNKDDLKFYLPYLGTFLIILGAVKVVVYYNFFGFSISTYLDLTEILSLFLKDIIMLSSTLLFTYLFLFFTISSKEKINISIEFNEEFVSKSFYKRLYIYLTAGYINLVLFTVLWLPFSMIIYWIFDIYKISIGLYICVVIGRIISIVGLEYSREYYLKHKKGLNPMIRNLTQYVVVAFAIILLYTFIEYRAVKVGKIYSGTTIYTNTDTLVSNNSNYFIGNIRNFVFFYNELNNSVIAIPVSEINKIEIRKKGIKSRNDSFFTDTY